MKDSRDRKDFTRLKFALATGAAAAGADFFGAEFGLPYPVALAATFGAAFCLSLLAYRLVGSGKPEDVPARDPANQSPGAGESAPGGAALRNGDGSEDGGPSLKDCNSCAEQFPILDRLLERAALSNASVTEETETAVEEIMTQLESIDATVSALLDYMDHSYKSVVDVVARTEKGMDDNRRVIAEFLERRGGDLLESESRHARIEEMATSLASATKSIRSVARQTHMLALNAMIEASRAGEFGAGFAVVAGEVKSLSKLTDQAAQEIGAGIENIRTAIRDSNVVDVENRVEVEQTELGGVSTSIGELSRQTEKLVAYELDVLVKVQSESARIGHSVSQLMGSIQFQDVTRQRLEHLGKVSNLAREHLREVSQQLASGAPKIWTSIETLAAAVEEEGPSPPRREVHGALVEMF